MIKLAIVCSLIHFSLHGAISPTSHKVEIEKIEKLKDELTLKSSEVVKLAASIRSIENKIGKLNSSYLERVEQARLLGGKVARLDQDLQSHKVTIDKEQEKLNNLLRKYILEVQDDEDDLSLLRKEVIKQAAKKRQENLDEVRTKYEELSVIYDEYKQRLVDLEVAEKELYSVIVDLENQKKNMSEKYVQTSNAQDEIEQHYVTLRAREKAYAHQSALTSEKPIRFVSPIEGHYNFTENQSGLTYSFRESLPIRAGATGEVVYTGELAAYGHVVIVDHGLEIRSVLLGDMNIKVKKGDKVEQGQLLAYTQTQNGVKKNLYYEVRRKNVAQKTVEWMKNSEQIANI